MKIQTYDLKSIATVATMLFTVFLSCGGLFVISRPQVPMRIMLNPVYPSDIQGQPFHEDFLANFLQVLGPVLAAAVLFIVVVAVVDTRRGLVQPDSAPLS